MIYRMIGQPTTNSVTIVKNHCCAGPSRDLPTIELLVDDIGPVYLLGRDLMRMAGRPELGDLSNTSPMPLTLGRQKLTPSRCSRWAS